VAIAELFELVLELADASYEVGLRVRVLRRSGRRGGRKTTGVWLQRGEFLLREAVLGGVLFGLFGG
jgi:hypothetical protein